MKGGLRIVAVVVGVVLLGASLAAAASAQKKKQNPNLTPAALAKLKGTIVADGSSTVGPFTIAAAELFKKAGAKDVRITVGISGTGGGFERFCKAETDLQNASRPMKQSEAAECQKNGVGWRGFHVVNDALTVVINNQNTWAKCLTVAELKKIWEPGSKINNWKDVRSGFPDVPLKLYGAGTDSGTFDYFTEVINGKSRASRSDYSPSEDDNVTVQGVKGDKGAMGYFGFSYFEENQKDMKALEVENPKTGACVPPSIKTAQDGSYKPLARPLFIYAKAASFKKPEVQRFFDFIVANGTAIATRAEFVPLTAKQTRRVKTLLGYAEKAANKS
jgi:phosphate transport system substrate-binding protein